MEQKVYLAVIKDDEGFVQGIYVNATHQGSLRTVCGEWLSHRVKAELTSEQSNVTWHERRVKEVPCNKHLQSQLETCQKYVTNLFGIQQLLAQEKLEEAINAYNDMGGLYRVDLSDEPVGS